MTRRRFLQGALAGSLLAGACATGQAKRPNLLVLVTDDQRADSTGFGGGPRPTPHLDALARESAVFSDAFVTTSVCACSRASLLSGQTVSRHGIRNFGTPFTPAALARTYPALLRRAGYYTGFVGKWGLGGALPSSAFDSFDGFSRQGRYFHEVDGRRRHLTDLLTEASTEFIEQAPRDQPFCLSVSYKAPHGPWDHYAPRFADAFDDLPLELSTSASPQAASRLPPFLQQSIGARAGREWVQNPEALRAHIRDYHRLVAGVDESIGQLREAIARRGAAQDTAILFTSDNGLLMGEHGLIGKWLMFEESIRVPLLLHLPGEGEPGRRIEQPVLNIDVAPTLLALAGLEPAAEMQGRSLVGLARGESEARWRQDWFYEHDLDPGQGYLPRVEGVRTSGLKYIHYLDPSSQQESLFDLRRDPLELEDVAGDPQYRESLARLRARWQRLQGAAAAPGAALRQAGA